MIGSKKINIYQLTEGTLIPLIMGGKENVYYDPIDASSNCESNATRLAFEDSLTIISQVAPHLRKMYDYQRELFVRWGRVAVGEMLYRRILQYPGGAGTIGISPITPENIRSSFGWDVPLEQGNDTPLFRDEATLETRHGYYRTSPGSIALIAHNGIIQMNTEITDIDRITIATEAYSPYTGFGQPPVSRPATTIPYTDKPMFKNSLARETVVDYRGFYFNTPAIPLWPNFGTRILLHGTKTKTAQIALFGLMFSWVGKYE